jgi:hypothetical protein
MFHRSVQSMTSNLLFDVLSDRAVGLNIPRHQLIFFAEAGSNSSTGIEPQGATDRDLIVQPIGAQSISEIFRTFERFQKSSR